MLMALTADQSHNKTTKQLTNLFLDMYDAQGIDTTDMRKTAMGDYEDKELYHEMQVREQETKESNPEEYNYSLK